MAFQVSWTINSVVSASSQNCNEVTWRIQQLQGTYKKKYLYDLV
jgi:hypothetical protein